MIYLLQPSRDGSMQLFIDLAVEYFDISVHFDFCSDVSAIQAGLISAAKAPPDEVPELQRTTSSSSDDLYNEDIFHFSPPIVVSTALNVN